MLTNQNHIAIDDDNRPKRAEYQQQASDQDDDDEDEDAHNRAPQESVFFDSARRLGGQQQMAASGGELRTAPVGGGNKSALPRNTGKLYLAAIVHYDSLPASSAVMSSSERQQQVDRNSLASNCDENADLNKGDEGARSSADNNIHQAKQRTTTTLAKLGRLFALNKRTVGGNNDSKSSGKSSKRTLSSQQEYQQQLFVASNGQRLQQDDLIDSSQKCKTTATATTTMTMMMNCLPLQTRGLPQLQRASRGDCAIQSETSALPPDLSASTSASSATETGGQRENGQQGKAVVEFKFDLIVEGDGRVDEEDREEEDREEEQEVKMIQNESEASTSRLGERSKSQTNARDDKFLRPIKQRKLLDNVNELVESFVLDSIDACLMSTGRRHLRLGQPDELLNDEFDYIFQLAKLSLTYAFQLLLATKRTATKTTATTETTKTTDSSDDRRHLTSLPPPPPALDAADDDCSIELEAILFNQIQGPHPIEIVDLLAGEPETSGHQSPEAPRAIDCKTIEEAHSALKLIRGNVSLQSTRQRQQEANSSQFNRLLMISLKLKQVINGGSFSNRMCLINLSEPRACELAQIFESIFNGQALAHLKGQKNHLRTLEIQLELMKRSQEEEEEEEEEGQQEALETTLTGTPNDETLPCSPATGSGSEFEQHNLKHHQIASLTRLIQAEWLIYKQLSAALIKSLVIVHCHRLQRGPQPVASSDSSDRLAKSKAQFELYLMDYNLSMLEFARTIQRASSSRLKRRRRHLRHGHLNSATNLSLVSDTNLSLDDLSPPHDRLDLAAHRNGQKFGLPATATAGGASLIKAQDLLISTPFRRPHLSGSSSAARRRRAACLECRIARGSGSGDDDDDDHYDDECDSGDNESDGHSSHYYDLNSMSLANSCRARLSSQQYLHQHKTHRGHRSHYNHHGHHHHHQQRRHYRQEYERAYSTKDSRRNYGASSCGQNHYQQQQQRYNSIGNRRVPHHHHHHHRHDEQDVLSIDATTYGHECQAKSQASTLASKRRRQSGLTETSSLSPSTSSGSQRGTARRQTNETLIQSSSSSNGGDCSSGAGTSTTLTIASYLLNHQRQLSQMSQQLNSKNQTSINNNLSDTEDSLASATLNSYSSQSHLGRYKTANDATGAQKLVFKQTFPAPVPAPVEGDANINRCLREDELRKYNARAKLQILQKRRLDSPSETSTSIDSPPSIELQSFSSNSSGQHQANLAAAGAPRTAAAASTFTSKFTVDIDCDERDASSITGGGYCLDHQSVASADQGLLMDDNTSDICSVVAEPPRQLKLEEFLNQLTSVIAPNKGIQQQQQRHKSNRFAGSGEGGAIQDGSEPVGPGGDALRRQGENVEEEDDDCKSHSSILEHLSSLTLESNLKLRHQTQVADDDDDDVPGHIGHGELVGIGSRLSGDYVIESSGRLNCQRPHASGGRVNIVDDEPVVGGHLQQLLKSTLQMQNNNNSQQLNTSVLLKHKIQSALSIDCSADRQHRSNSNGLSGATGDQRFEASPNQTPTTFTPTSTDSNGSGSSSSATSSLSIGTRGDPNQVVTSIHAHSSNAMSQLYAKTIRQHT